MSLVVVLALVSAAQVFDLQNILAYQSQAIGDGAWWLLISGHFAHLNFIHYALNTFAWVLIWVFALPNMTHSLWAFAFIFCALGTGLGMLLLSPELVWYVGLSGVLHGVMCVVLVRMAIHKPRDWLVYLVSAGLLAKIISEQLYGPSPSTAKLIGEPVIVEAHLYGLISGAVIGAHMLALNLYRRSG